MTTLQGTKRFEHKTLRNDHIEHKVKMKIVIYQ